MDWKGFEKLRDSDAGEGIEVGVVVTNGTSATSSIIAMFGSGNGRSGQVSKPAPEGLRGVLKAGRPAGSTIQSRRQFLV